MGKGFLYKIKKLKKKVLPFLVMIICCAPSMAQISVVNPKGTIVTVDSSKWQLNGANIINKNAGNIGVGNNNPLFKLDVSATVDPLRLLGLQNGTANADSLVVSQNGVIKKIAPINSFIINRPDSTTASNGLNLNGKDVRLGGPLVQSTTISNNSNPLIFATGGSPFRITGLPTGVAARDSLVTVRNGRIRKLAPISTFIRPDSTTASNGLNLNGKDVRLGGNLIQPTTINSNANALTFATGGTALNITGLPIGTAATDSLVTVQNGLVRKIAPINSFIVNRPDSTTASNGLNLNGKDVRLGGNLIQPTTINSNANALTFATGGTALNITGLPIGTAATDSLVTVQNGAIRKIAPVNSFIVNRPDSTTASNGLNLNGKDVRLGGNLTQATTIISNTNALTFATGGTALNITGLPNGTAATDSLVTVQNGLVRKIAPVNSFIVNRPDSTTASNGLNLNGKDVRLGGPLTQATTIATQGNALNITGLPTGVSATDSLITVQNGLVRKIAPINSFIVNRPDSTTASNGLNLNGKDVRLGGNLTQATTINSNANALTFATGGTALNITGLPVGTAATDSLVTVQNGLVRKIAPINSFIVNRPDSTTASNGLNLNGKDVRLGGNLIQPTTITSNANALTFATGGTALNITGLPVGVSATDSLVTVQNGLVRKIAPINSFIVNRPDSTTASNGLNLNGKDVRLGGPLTQATTIATQGNALNITGLPTGVSATDSLVTVQNGLVRKIAPINSFIVNRPDSTTASNGLNLNGKDVRLGGNLIQPTTINSNANALTFATGGTALNITGLPVGVSATDSLVTVQNGLVRKIAPINSFIVNKPDSTTASNGLNLNGKDVRLGGPLTQATTIATQGNALNITGLPIGVSATDSLVTVQNGLIRKIAPINTFIVNRPDSTTASNGLNLNGKDVRLGGPLTQATTIATQGNALNITGLPVGTAATDSLVTVQNGLIRKIAPINSFIVNRPDSTTASNGLNLNGKDVRLGGPLTQATTIATQGNALNITGLPVGIAATDSLVTVQNGAIRKIAPVNSFIVNRPDSTTASNGLNLNGKDVRLGGPLTQATTIATQGNALNITGLPTGVSATDSLVTVQNGLVRKIAPVNSFIVNRPDSTTASNGLNLNGKDVRLGGNLTQATTIATQGNALNITGLPVGVSATDSLVTVQNGLVRKIAPINSFIVNRPDSTTASNGLNLNGKDVRLGGNLTQPTTINSNANALTFATGGTALNITGLPTGVSATDSLVTVQNGLVRKIAPINSFIINRPDSTTASNGLNLNGKDVRLGGPLTQTTTIATAGNALNITGLPSGASTDSLVTINNATGQLRKIPMTNTGPAVIEILDAAGTQALTTTFANLVLGTTNIADPGYTIAAGAITVVNAGTYRITARATVRVTSNNSSGGEFRLTAGGTAIPGTLGYTYQHNANRPFGTVTIVKMINLDANTVIAIQGRRYSNNGNLVLVANGSTLLIEKVK